MRRPSVCAGKSHRLRMESLRGSQCSSRAVEETGQASNFASGKGRRTRDRRSHEQKPANSARAASSGSSAEEGESSGQRRGGGPATQPALGSPTAQARRYLQPQHVVGTNRSRGSLRGRRRKGEGGAREKNHLLWRFPGSSENWVPTTQPKKRRALPDGREGSRATRENNRFALRRDRNRDRRIAPISGKKTLRRKQLPSEANKRGRQSEEGTEL